MQHISENLYEKASSLLQMKNEILKGTQAFSSSPQPQRTQERVGKQLKYDDSKGE